MQFFFRAQGWGWRFCLTGFVGDPAAKPLIALVSQQINNDSPATVPMLQDHKKFLDFPAKPCYKRILLALKNSLVWKITNMYKKRELYNIPPQPIT